MHRYTGRLVKDGAMHRHGAEAQNFAWKFVWIFRTKVQNYKNIKVQKNTKVFITEAFFELQTSDFAW